MKPITLNLTISDFDKGPGVGQALARYNIHFDQGELQEEKAGIFGARLFKSSSGDGYYIRMPQVSLGNGKWMNTISLPRDIFMEVQQAVVADYLGSTTSTVDPSAEINLDDIEF